MIYLSLFLVIFLPCTLQNPIDAKKHLQRYGFWNSSTPDSDALKEAITKFQKINKLNVTGELNDETIQRMGAQRCGKPDNVPDFLTPVDKWEKTYLTYKIHNWTEPYTKSSVKTILDETIKTWTRDVNLKIEETEEDADFTLFFTHQDGPLAILGYAFFPENGDIFLDKDENWTLDVFSWVLAHELGHSLGLPHSESIDSIMFPYYNTNRTKKPSETDVQYLRSKYGPARFNNTLLCSGAAIDAILDTPEPKLIIGNQYWSFSKGAVQNGPFPLDAVFPGLPEKIDAAFAFSTTRYFLTNLTYFKFHSNNKTSRQKWISTFDEMPSKIDAAFFDRNSTIYFFKDSKYYELSTIRDVGKRLVVNGKNLEKDWKGVPKNVEAVTMINGSQVLFIKKFKCYLVDLGTRELISKKDCSDYYQCK